MIRGITFVLLVAVAVTAVADDGASAELAQRGFVDQVYPDADGEHRYVVFVPEGDPPDEGWPVILFLHGAGERGTDGRRQLSVGLGPLVKLRSATYPAVVVFPQSENVDGPILRSWSPRSADGRRALAILADVEKRYPTNPGRRILTGWSMGGFGAWGLAAADPGHWSAVVPVSGGGKPEWAARLTDVPLWAFHGANDRIVPASASLKMVQAVRDAGGNVLYSEIEDEGHDVWRRVYDSDVVLDWMLSPHTDRPELESTPLPEDRTLAEAQPFAPAMIIERAVTLRLGQEAIKTIAIGLPASFAEDGFSGELDDVSDVVELDGREFDVRFGELSYTAELDRTLIRTSGPDRAKADIGLRNVRLHVGRVSVTDGRVGFTAGPVEVVIGHREPVWLRVEVRPAVDDGRLTLKLLRSSFEFPDSNWFVRDPETVRLQGDWLTEEEVKTAVVGGIYERRETIEEQVLSAVPAMLDRFGEEVDLSPLAHMVEALWPLPVYQPEVQVIPESISTDAQGLSLTLSVAIAAMEATPPETVKVVQASGPAAYEIARTPDMRISVAVDVLDHISSMLAGTSAARIYASDIPEQPFVELSDPETVSRAIPELSDLSPDAELLTSFTLEAPLHVRPVDANVAPREPGVAMLIEAPRLTMRVSRVGPDQLQETAATPQTVEVSGSRGFGKPVLIFEGDLQLQQPLILQPAQTAEGRPGLRIVWDTEVQVTATVDGSRAGTAHGGQAAAQEMARLFTQGWKRWTAAQTEQVVALPEVSLGSASLTMQELFWEGTSLSARFSPAATQIVNRTDSPVTYLVRGPYTRWSEPRTLAAGAVTKYETGTELRLRPERHWEFDEITLPTATTWECRSPSRSRKLQWTRTDQAVLHPDGSGEPLHQESRAGLR